MQRLSRWQRRLHFLAIEITLQHGHVVFRDEILARHLPWLNQLREGSARRGHRAGIGLRAIVLGLPAVRGRKQVERRSALRGVFGRGCERRAADLLHDAIESRKRLVEGLRLVRDLELQKGRALHERLCTGAIVDPRKLDHDAIVTDLLHDRLRHAELIDAIAHDLERTIDRLGLVRDHAFTVIDFEREIHPALQIETALQRNARARRVVKFARLRITLANRDGTRPERPNGRDHEHDDDEETITDIRVHAA